MGPRDGQAPFGLAHSGPAKEIISAQGRHLDELKDVENQDFLQTDAAISPGNSGGPLAEHERRVDRDQQLDRLVNGRRK